MLLVSCEEEPINTNPLTQDPEGTCEILNSNIDALHAIIEAITTDGYVTNCTTNGSKRNITFNNNRSVNLYFQSSPNYPLAYAKKENGVYYWFFKGNWLLDDRGNKVNVLEHKLQFKIEDGFWFVSIDGVKFTNCGEVAGDECIKFFQSSYTNGKEFEFVLVNNSKYQHTGYGEDDIHFEDPMVEEICLKNWDKNKDKRLSKFEAAAVTDITNKFQDKTITTFNELQYFTGLTEIGKSAFDFCMNLTSIVIPNSVTNIACDAFYGCVNLTTINIPNSVTNVEERAFYGCASLTSINIPNSITNIACQTFDGCTSLTTIYIPSSITDIGNRAFAGCTELMSIIIPSSVTNIGDSAFKGCAKLTTVTIQNSEIKLGEDIFGLCSNLTSFEGVLASSDGRCLIQNNKLKAFAPAGISTYTIPSGVTSIASYAFADCANLISIDIPNSVTYIMNFAFYKCSRLTPTTIPNNVIYIGGYAFYECTSLTSITIPNNVTHIGEYAFYGCSNLTTVYCRAIKPPTLYEYAFDNNASMRILYVPMSSVDAYKSTTSGWSKYANYIIGYDF